MAERRFPYGRAIDWTPDFSPAWLPAVALIAWREISEGRAWTLPLYALGGYLLGIMLRHTSRHSTRNGVRDIEGWFERTSTTKLLLVSVFIVTPIAFLVVGIGMYLWDVLS